MRRNEVDGKKTARLMAVIGLVSAGFLIIAGLLSVTVVGLNDAVVIEDIYGNPTGEVLTEPGVHWLGLTRWAFFNDIAMSDVAGDLEDVRAVGFRGDNFDVIYRAKLAYPGNDVLVALRRHDAIGNGRQTAMVNDAAKAAVTNWIAAGRPNIDLGKEAAVNLQKEWAFRGVSGTPAMSLTIVSVERM